MKDCILFLIEVKKVPSDHLSSPRAEDCKASVSISVGANFFSRKLD